MEKVKILVEKFKAQDGLLFDKEQDCILHEKRLNGTIKTCGSCHGDKVVDPYGDGRVTTTYTVCNGKGYVEKVEKWE